MYKKTITEFKKRPDFSDNVGRILIHNSIVRNWSCRDRQQATALETTVDDEKIARTRQEYLEWPGIYDIIIETCSGCFAPGDDLLFIQVAGDIREYIKPVLAEPLDRIKIRSCQ